MVGQVHADVEHADIEKPGVRTEGRRLPVLLTDVRWADPIELYAGLGFAPGRRSGRPVFRSKPLDQF